MSKKRVLVGMSGGVDSTAAVVILKNLGYEVVGITFKFIEDFDSSDAVFMAKKLNIEHHVVDYVNEFKDRVINRFNNDYKNGLTPNPCIICNRLCKFNYLFENMEKYNCDFIATGHYAKIDNNKLYKSVDLEKDQSYFLYDLSKDKLSKIIFPLEGYKKSEIFDLASDYKLEAVNKKESYDVCFITGSFSNYIKNTIIQNPGDVINIENLEIIGKHDGLANYTIGQRKGLNIGGNPDRLFVVGKDIEKNVLYVCLGNNNDYLLSDSCIVDNINYIGDERLNKCSAKFRYRQKDIDVEVEFINDSSALVKYPQGLKSVTPGQACVFYNGDECLGGGIIKEVRKNDKKLWYL